MAEPYPNPRAADFSLYGIVNYANKVYRLFDGFRSLNDSRAADRTSIPQEDAVNTAFMMMLLGYKSMNRFFKAILSGGNRRKHCILSAPDAAIPSRSTVERVLAATDPEDLQDMLWGMVRKAHKNGALKDAQIDGHTIGILDGIKIHSSSCKQCDEYCQISTNSNGTQTYSHKMVMLSTPCIGGTTGHLALAYCLLGAGDPEGKAEGELTGAKRLLRELDDQMPHVCSIITGDALYANAPFVNAVKDIGADAVIRLKGDDRVLMRQGDAMFDHGRGTSESFCGQNRKGELVLVTAQHACFHMKGVDGDVRLVRFTEIPIDDKGQLDIRKGKGGRPGREIKTVYMISSNPDLKIETIWQIAHLRWDIEDSCFQVLTTDFHLKHLYSPQSVSQMTALMLLAFNLRTLYLFRFRRRDFLRKHRIHMWDFTERLRQDLNEQALYNILLAGGP